MFPLQYLHVDHLIPETNKTQIKSSIKIIVTLLVKLE